ncbi:MAG: diguanylate cyclase [Phycisphaerae bacterium]
MSNEAGSSETTPAAHRPRIGEAFQKRALVAILLTAALASIAFVSTATILLDRMTEEAIAGQAQIVGASLQWASHDDIEPTASKLLLDIPQLECIASVNPTGGVTAVYPSNPQCQQAVAITVSSRDDVVSTPIAARVSGHHLVGVPVRDEDLPTNAKPRFVLMFGVKSVFWLGSAWLLVSAAIVFAIALCIWSHITHWFNTKVSQPLNTLAPFANGTMEGKPDRTPPLLTGGWYELERVAEAFRSMRKDLVQSHVRQRQVKRIAEEKMQDKTSGLQRKLRRAEDNALRDGLTGLRNRAFIEQELEIIVQDAVSRGEDLALVMIDLDHFKRHNDTHGHAAGDEVLTFVGKLLEGAVRPSDHAMRFGGDEFALLLPNTDTKQAVRIADRIIKLFQQYAQSLPIECGVTISAGAASLLNSNACNGEQLIRVADQVLYKAKYNGKNRVLC